MKNTLIILLAVMNFSCGYCQENEILFIESNTPLNVGINEQLINNLVSDIKAEKIINIHSLLIIKDDKLVVEQYFGDYDRDELHYSASVSKSFASTLLGIAIDKGFFNGNIHEVLNKKVSQLFPDYAHLIERDPMKQELALKHILSMTAGFEWDEHTYAYTDSRNDCNRINNNNDPMEFLFVRQLIYPPGSDFYYNGGLSLAISYLIQEYTGMPADDFAEEYLFGPLDITDYRWDDVENGLIDTDGGLHLKPIDQAKLGYLFLNEGIWKDKQIVSKEWVKESTKMHRINQNMPDYGYQWWGGDFYALNRTFFIYMASGHGGQKIVVIPEFDMVVVITQQVFNNQYGDLNFIAILSDYILPAASGKMDQVGVIEIGQGELAKFEGRYTDTDGKYIDVIKAEGKLVLRSSNGEQNDFYPISDTIFKTRILDLLNIEIEFVHNPQNNIESIESKFGFMERSFIKSK